MSEEDSEFEINRRGFIASAVALGVVSTLPLPLLGRTEAGERRDHDAQDSTNQAYHRSPQNIDLHLKINGKDQALKIDSRETLLDVLRERLELTGAKKGCDHGQCGACTVLIDGKRVNSCLSLAAQCQGKSVTTIEGLASGDHLHPMQAAFIEQDAFQCGFCTPGQIMSAVSLLNEPCGTSEKEVRECMSGNICRCGAYRNILSAISQVRKGGKHASV